MSLKIAGIEFTNHEYDDRGDVLYLDIEGYNGGAADYYASPEGHAIEFDQQGRAIAMTLVNVRWLMERDGDLRLTWPDGHVTHDAPSDVLAEAA
jgi:uncharacterized protein YuzE